MRRKMESNLWAKMRSNISPSVRLWRIENVVGTGMPDVLAIGDSVVTPVELKAVHHYPAKISKTPLLGRRGLNPAQKNWHKEWQAHGGRSAVIIGVQRQVYVIRGEHADDINEMTAPMIAELSVIPSAVGVNWKQIELFLRGEL